MLRAEVELLMHRLFRRAGAPAGGGPPDGALLERFARNRDEAAFAALVERHGPMVFGVCRRVLGHQQDAEDAFQATFLILARRASALDRRGSVAAWLHTVARRLALRARADAARQQTADPRDLDMRSAKPDASAAWHDVRPVLDEELERLPEKYRLPVVLCCLEGRTQAEAARQLGWPEGTVSGRLARARAILRDRLERRGVTLSAGLLATVLADGARAGPVPAALARLTVRNAVIFAVSSTAAGVSAKVAALAKGGLQAMVTAKLKVGALVLGIVLVLGGAGVWAQQALSDRPAPEQAPAEARSAKADEEKPQARVDLYGDPLPEGAVARLGTLRWRHPAAISAVAYSPDGKLAASGCTDGRLRLWDAATGQLLREIVREGLRSPIRNVAFLTNGSQVLCYGSPQISLWDVATGDSLPCGKIAGGGFPNASAVSPDGRMLANGSHPPDPLFLCDLTTDKEAIKLEGHEAEVRAVSYSPQGDRLASADRGGVILLWDVATRHNEARLIGHKGPVGAVAFSPDGKLLASAGAAAVSPDGKPLAPTGDERIIRLWDVATRQEVGQLHDSRPSFSFWHSAPLVFTPDGKFLAQGNRLWEVATRRLIRTVETQEGTPWGPVAISPDGKSLAIAMHKRLHLSDVATGKERSPAGGYPEPIGRLTLSPDGKLAATLGDQPHKVLRLWSTEASREVRQVSAEETYFCTDPEFSRDGRLLAVGTGDNTIRLLEVDTGREVRRLSGHEHGPHCLQFSRDGRLLASEGWDRTVRVWDVASGKEVRQFPIVDDQGKPVARSGPDGNPLPRPAGGVALSPDGTLLAAWNEKRATSLWDVATGKLVRQVPSETVQSLAFSSDGRTLVTYGYLQVCFWNVATGLPIHPLGVAPMNRNVMDPASVKAHAEFPTTSTWSSALSPDDRTLALARYEKGSSGDVISLYEMATGKERLRLRGHRGRITSLHFTADCRGLASASADTTALIWDLTGRQGTARVPTEKERATAWEDLASGDAERAYQAIWALASTPAEPLPLLRQRLRPAPAVAAEMLKQWIKELDDARFAQRDLAGRQLEAAGAAAEPLLKQALAGQPSAELRQRVEQLLQKLHSPVTHLETLRSLRALEVLEHIGTADARALLKALAAGAPEARQTREAKAALQRLAATP